MKRLLLILSLALCLPSCVSVDGPGINVGYDSATQTWSLGGSVKAKSKYIVPQK